MEQQTPTFGSAVVRLQRFLAEEGWPTRILWSIEADILRPRRGDIVVRRRWVGDVVHYAREHYEAGRRSGVRVALEVRCEVDGAACTTVSWTTDAQDRMVPDGGLDLSVATPHRRGRSVGALRWWLAAGAARVRRGVRPRA